MVLKIPDIATPFVNGLNKLGKFLWLHLRQAGLMVYCLVRGRKVNVRYFGSIQQALIHGVPAYLCWDAQYFYKVTINGINVTFNRAPILYSNHYTGKFTLQAWGLFSKQTLTIEAEVKEKYSATNYQSVQLNYAQCTTFSYHDIEQSLTKSPSITFVPKGFEIKLPAHKQIGLHFKNEQIIDETLLLSLQNKNAN